MFSKNLDEYKSCTSNLRMNPFCAEPPPNQRNDKINPLRKVYVLCTYKKIYKHTKDSMYKNQSD